MPPASYRLRVQLPDRPGALARVSALLAEGGASVIGVDIHLLDEERDAAGERVEAVDEILVRVPDGWSTENFASALLAAGAGSLLSALPDQRNHDPIVRALRWVGLIVDAGAATCDLELSRVVAEISSASAAWVGRPSEAESFEAGRLALERGTSVIHLTQRLPGPLSLGTDEEGWVLAVVDDPGNPRRLALASRPATVRFTSSEVQRVEALLALVRTLSAR